jgi:lipopolysaccharide transport system permease protein/teichoic acid transport system permease protein
MIPDKYQFFLKLNPVFYIINGYRDALIYRRWFWESWELTLYFWCITLLIFVTGATLFKRLRPHFADIL